MYRLNWGNGLFLVIVGFIGFMAFMVSKSLQQDFFLVSKDYYKQEIAYQNQIDKQTNVRDENSKPKLKLHPESKTMEIAFGQADAKGKVVFFRPSNASLDFELPIAFREGKPQIIDLATVVAGLWVVKIEWQAGAKHYYSEENIVL